MALPSRVPGVARWFQRAYWGLVRPETRGVRAIVIDEVGKVLLVRHTYGEGWYLPGGGVRRGEALEAAVRRELWEETGLTGDYGVAIHGTFRNTREFKKDTISVHVVHVPTVRPTANPEIAEQRYFDVTALPPDVSPGTRRRIEELRGLRAQTGEW